MGADQKILIVRLSSIGDIIHCSGVPRNLKAHFPQSQIHWLVRSDNAELLKFNPAIDKIIPFDRYLGLRGWIKLCQALDTEGYTHVYDAHNNPRSIILSLFVHPRFFIRRSKNRLKRFLLFWLKINLFDRPYIPTESYVTPLEKWGVKSDHGGPALYVAPEILERAKTIVSSGVSIALAPATAWKKKNWPESSWKNLVTLILERTKLDILILGGPNDDFCKNLILDEKRVKSLQGELSVLESAAVASLCKTLVVGDTGLLHMTEALGKNIIGLFGPTPFGRPTRKDSLTFDKKLWCSPCSKDGSGPCLNLTYQKCMKEIGAQSVFDGLLKATENSNANHL